MKLRVPNKLKSVKTQTLQQKNNKKNTTQHKNKTKGITFKTK